MQNSILNKMYATYEKNAGIQNCLFQKDLQLYLNIFFMSVISFVY